MPSYQYKKSHCGDMTVRSSYLHNGIPYIDKTSLYWIRALGVIMTLSLRPLKAYATLRNVCVCLLAGIVGTAMLVPSVGNSHRSASPRPTTLEVDRELFVNFSLIWCLCFEIQDLRTYNFFDWISNTACTPSFSKRHCYSLEDRATCRWS